MSHDSMTRRGSAPPSPPGAPGQRVIESLSEAECLRMLAAGRVGRLAYTGREGPTVLPVEYRLPPDARYPGGDVTRPGPFRSPVCGPEAGRPTN
jgi:Pyridoxamine 5'-phosphate oxidase